jgi:hypothetical protein
VVVCDAPRRRPSEYHFVTLYVFACGFVLTVVVRRQPVGVNVPTLDPPTPRSQAANRAAQQREHDRAAQAKEMKTRRQARFDSHNEDYRLRKQQGLSPRQR